MSMEFKGEDMKFTAPFRVDCETCKLQGPEGVSEEDAADHWNTRTLEQELLAALRNLLTLSECGDESGYVDGEGWLPMDQIQEAARKAIARAEATEGMAR